MRLTDWTVYPAIATGILLGLIILSEVSVMTYFKRSTYKKIDIKDIIGIISLLIGGGVIVNSLLLIPQIGALAPEPLLSFFGVIGVIVSVGAGILALVHILTPKFA